MAEVSFQPDGRCIEVGEGESVLGAAIRSGIPHYHVCGGKGRCSTCRVLVVEGLDRCSAPTAAEDDLRTRLRLPAPVRLACQMQADGPVLLRRLVLDGEDVRLARSDAPVTGPVGEERTLAVLFADLANFTRFSEGAPAYDVVHVLNRWFDGAAGAVAAHGGRLDNTMGDGLLAVFGLEGTAEDAALAGLRAGLGILAAADALRTYVHGLFDWELEVRVGLHVGEVVVGAIGPSGARRTTVIGDAVNFASRIEGANKEARTRFLASDAVRALVGGRVPLRGPVDLAVKGKTGVHRLWEVVGPAAP